MKKGQIYSSMLNADWLKGSTPAPHELTVTVAGGYEKEFDEGNGVKKKQWVLTFQEDVPDLGLNLTNWDAMEEITGKDDSEHWRGSRIVVYATTTRFGTKTVDCVRVRAAGGASQQQAKPASSTPPQTHFGDDMASKVLAFAGTNGLELADIEQNMLDAGYPAEMVRGGMARWPIGWKDAVRLACQNKPIEPYTGMTADEIPF